MNQPLPPTAAPLLDGLAARIARRDLPPAVKEANGFEPAQVLRRLAEALVPLLPDRNAQGRSSQARMLYQLMQHEAQTSAELARAAGLARLAGSQSHHGLVRAGLVHGAYEGRGRTFRLTRWGEDWVLAAGRGEVPPARPVG